MCALCTEGISPLQMVHQVAQNLRITTLPRKSFDSTVLPSRSGKLKLRSGSGAERAVKPGEIALVDTDVVMAVFCEEPQAAPPNPSEVATMNALRFMSKLL
jgi:hypothetical protein